jgi:hypothetical protein
MDIFRIKNAGLRLKTLHFQGSFPAISIGYTGPTRETRAAFRTGRDTRVRPLHARASPLAWTFRA